MVGVSMTPTGLTDVPAGMVTSVTAIGPAVFPAPLRAMVTVPLTLVDMESPAGFTVIDRSPPPLLEVGVTWSHG